MSNIILDHKMFDYSKIKEPLLAVPQSVFKSAVAKGLIVSPYFKNIKEVQAKGKTTWSGRKLTQAGLLRSYKIAMKEYKDGTLITL